MSKSKEQFMQHRERTRNLECERIKAQMDVEARFRAALKSGGGVKGGLLSLAEAECNKRNHSNADKEYCKAYEQGWIEATNWFLQKLKQDNTPDTPTGL